MNYFKKIIQYAYPYKQYAFLNFESASKKWVLRLLNKAIIVDKNGVIIDGFANFASSNFSKELR